MNWKGFKDKVCDPNEYHPFPFHLGRFMVFINIILLEIIFNNFRLANVISGQVHLFFFFMKMQMLGIVSAYNKRLADMGRGGGVVEEKMSWGAVRVYGKVWYYFNVCNLQIY